MRVSFHVDIFLQASSERAEATAYLNRDAARLTGTLMPQSGSIDIEMPVSGYEKMGASYKVRY